MILRLDRDSLGAAAAPGWEKRVARDGDAVVVRGDDTGEVVLFLHSGGRTVTVSDDAGELLSAMGAAGATAEIDAGAGLSHFLHDGLVPVPRTLFRDVFVLSIGDRATVRREGERLRVDFSVEFPYYTRLSREDQAPDHGRFLALLADSLERRLASYRSGVLFLSAGKDSVALALALAERGRKDVPCVTYALPGSTEGEYAKGFCRKLGLSHTVVTLESRAAAVRDALTRFFTESPLPSGDLTQIPSVLLTEATAAPGGAVVVGSGNDTFFGALPYPKDRRIVPFCLGRTALVDPLKPLLPPASVWNYLLRDPVEILWPGLLVRHADTRKFLAGSVNTSPAWRRVRAAHRGMDIIDFRALYRGRNFEVCTEKRKIQLAARAFGVGAVFPYVDERVIDFYFNLPREQRYDPATWTTKRLMRDLLRERLQYDDAAIGKWGFPFDGAAFVRTMRDTVLGEITACGLFDRKGLGFLERSVARVDAHRYAWHHVVALFQFAGWYNHSRYLRS
jgi:asparagine synthase (glutamine-hydrolysing)